MKRRDFLVTTATMAGAAIPVIGLGQTRPCPPPSMGAGGGTSATTPCSTPSAAADWAARIGGAEVVITGWGSPPFDATVMEAADRLRLIAHSAGSIKHLLPPAVFERGVAVTHAAGAIAPRATNR